jgi:hypothetical protein
MKCLVAIAAGRMSSAVCLRGAMSVPAGIADAIAAPATHILRLEATRTHVIHTCVDNQNGTIIYLITL